MILPRGDPTTFRRPTSLARFADLAVERLTKFILARIKMNNSNCAEQPNKADIAKMLEYRTCFQQMNILYRL